MNIERTVHICGKDVKMRYCTATETGYESISGKSSVIFIPKVTEDDKGKIISVEPQTNISDCVTLAVAGIIAAYSRLHQDAPVSSDDILYDATPDEVQKLITAILEMRNEWYMVPNMVKPEGSATDNEDKSDPEQEKN